MKDGRRWKEVQGCNSKIGSKADKETRNRASTSNEQKENILGGP
jgi:hypothetical protein